jgi:hypothetical protein
MPTENGEFGPVTFTSAELAQLKAQQSAMAPVVCSAPSYDVFLGNNDYDTTGQTLAETLADISFELETAMSAVLLLRHGMSKQDALKAVDNLRWLVDQSDLPNIQAVPVDTANRKE